MTAFARAESTLDGTRLTWEIRSVNHRYLDVNVKLPEEFRRLEDAIRQKLTGSLARGRIDAHLKAESQESAASSSSIDPQAVEALMKVLGEIERAHPSLQPPRSIDILRSPGVVLENKMQASDAEQAILELLESGIGQLVDNRRSEGTKLGELVADRITRCRRIVAELNAGIEDIQRKSHEKWQKRIDRITTEVDNDRIAQEIALILTKSDVSEELDRLATHLDEVEKLLSSTTPVGRRLDFLMQELNREANTLGAKSIHQAMTDTSIELKVLIDQMREQIQNIE